MSVKGKRRIIALCYHFGVVLISLVGSRLGIATRSPDLTEIPVIVLVVHLITFRLIPVSRWLQEALIPEAVCFSCGVVIELIGLYRCGCGFLSHKERHAFSPCPMCGKYYSWVVCPECETSIPI